MPDLVNKVVFKIPPTLRVLQGLPLKDQLKELFSPWAKGNVILLDIPGRRISAKVNSQATFLKGAALADFLEAQGSSWLELSNIGDNCYRVTPVKEVLPANPEKEVTQLALGFPIEEQASRETAMPQEKIGSGPEPRKKTTEKLAPRTVTGTKTPGSSHGAGAVIEESEPSWGKSEPSRGKSQTKRALAGKEKIVSGKDALADKEKEKISYKSALTGKKRGETLDESAAVGQGRKLIPTNNSVPVGKSGGQIKNGYRPILENPRSVKKNLVLPAIAPVSAVGNPISSEETATLSPEALPSEAAFTLSGENSGVKVVFYSTEDAQVLKVVKEGKFSSATDFYLRQQALQLSVSPGFETLMSLNAARHLQPLDYQLKTVRHVLMNLRGRALLCDEVGMGKTVEAGLIALEYILRGLVRRVLVLAPPSLVEQWQGEMRSKFNLDFIVYDSAEFKAHPDPWAAFPRIIASIDTAKRESKQEQVLAAPYDLVIVDEAHHLKKQRSQSYQLVSRLKKKYILLLTATPVENDLEELFNLITLLFPGQLETAASFKRKYITRGDPLKPKNTETLKQLIREVMVRNRRSETGAIAGRRSADMIRIELTSEEKAFYQRLTVFVRGYYSTEGDKSQAGIHAFVLKILQREAGSSIEAVLPTLNKMAANQDYPESLRGLLAALAQQATKVPRRAKVEALLKLLPGIQGKVIIFTGFTETQRYLVQTLRAAGLLVAELHSGLRRQEKEEQVRLFAGEVSILVSTETGSEGRNLQFANHLINYDLPWNPMRIEQRIGRIHRLGQERDVHIYNFSAVDTIEAHILEILDAKINMFQLVVGELDMILGDLTEKQDFEDLIMDIWSRSDNEEKLKSEMEELGDRLVAAREHYLAVKELDDRLLGELAPEEEE